MIGKHCYCFWSRAVEGIRETRARAGVARDYSIGLESMSAITSFLNQSQKQQGRRHINHVLQHHNRGSRLFSDIYIKGLPVFARRYRWFYEFYYFIRSLLYSLMKTAGLWVFWRQSSPSEFLYMICCIIQQHCCISTDVAKIFTTSEVNLHVRSFNRLKSVYAK